MVNFNYDNSDIKPLGNYDPLPSDWYVAQITATEAKVPKSGQGKMVCITYEIIDGDFRGRKLWSNLCHEHPKKDTQEYARQHIAAISTAVLGHPHCKESEHLHQIPLKIKVKLKRDKNTEELVNEIVGYASADRIASPAPSNPSAGKQADTATPPWMRDMPEAAQ